jgi:hypothetical protein
MIVLLFLWIGGIAYLALWWADLSFFDLGLLNRIVEGFQGIFTYEQGL